MADAKLSAEPELTQGNLAAGDLLYVVDVSDTTDGAGGSSRKVQATNLLAPARFTAISNASPADGDVWYGSTQKTVSAQVNGIKHHLVGCLYSQGQDVTVTATGSDVTLCGDTGAIGSRTLPANFFVAGKSVRVTIRGFFSTVATPGTVLPKLFLGSTVLCQTAAARTLPASRSGEYWEFTGLLTCRSTGASGTLVVQGIMNMMVNTVSTANANYEMPNTSTVTIDTTSAQALNFTNNLNTSGNSITSQIMLIEALN